MSVWRHGGMLDAGGTIPPLVVASMVTFDPLRTFEKIKSTPADDCLGAWKHVSA